MNEFDPDKHVLFPALGRFGRLGNQLFQLAATCAHAWDLGLEPRFPLQATGELRDTFRLPESWFIIAPEEFDSDLLWQAPWNYEPIPHDKRVLHGYFQGLPFFDHHRTALRELLKLPGDRAPYRAIHVRRGDYLMLGNHHPLPSLDYYRATIEPETATVICTDDPNWCADSFHGLPNTVLSLGTTLDDLLLLRNAAHLTLSNSSFSWWAAYLGEAETVTYPKQWFGQALEDHDTSQLFMEHWEGA